MGERTYSVEIGTQRVDLPLVSLNEQLALALLITVDMGVEFMSRAGSELAKIIRPYDVDIVATVATMGIPVAVEVTRHLGLDQYVILHKTPKIHLADAVSESVRSITTDVEQRLLFDRARIKDVAGKRVLLRVDLNVPVRDGKITDLTRIERLSPTIVELAAKGAPIEFGKNAQNEWEILKPRPLRADGTQVDSLVSKLKDTKMDALISDEDAKKAAAAFASGAKVAVVAVSDSSGDQTLEVRKDKDKNYYAKSSVVEGIYKIPSDTGDALDKGLDDFRNKKLFDFGFSDPTKIELKGATYSKSGDKWMSGAKTMDNASVQSLIDKLRDLTAAKFADTGGGDPVFEAAVTSNEGKKVEKVTIRKQGTDYFAQREGEPSIYVLDAKPVEDLQAAAAAIKEAAPEPAKKK